MVGPGTGDNMAAALGLGLRPGDLAVSLGTSGTAYAVSEQPTADPSGTVAGFADATGRFLPLVCTLNATKVTDTVARLLGVDTERFDQLALEGPPGADGLVLVPHLDGERTPNRPDATGTHHRPAHRRHAGPARPGRGGRRRGQPPRRRRRPRRRLDGRVLLIGGGARSAAYRQVVADLAGRPVVVPREDELVACGAALQAATVLLGGDVQDRAAAWGLGTGDTIEPDPAVDGAAIRAAYAEATEGAR